MSHARHLLLTALLWGCAEPGQLAFTTERVELGPVAAGSLRVERVRLRNLSDGTLRLAGTSSSSPAFSLVFMPGTRLGSNDLVTLSVHHSPASGAVEPLRAQLRAWTDEGPEATLEVTSVPIKPDCELPEWIEFGPVRPGDALTWELPLQNSTSIDTHAEVDLSSATGGIFEVERGRHPITSGRAIELPITFRPGITAEFSGALLIRPHALCPTQRIELFGTGVIALVEPAATSMFWSTKIGVTETQLLPLRNHALTPVALFDPQVREGVDDSDVFRLTRFPGEAPGSRARRERAADPRGSQRRGLLHPDGRRDPRGAAHAQHRPRRRAADHRPPRGARESLSCATSGRSVRCKPAPALAGPRAGLLTMETDHPFQPSISINLRGCASP